MAAWWNRGYRIFMLKLSKLSIVTWVCGKNLGEDAERLAKRVGAPKTVGFWITDMGYVLGYVADISTLFGCIGF